MADNNKAKLTVEAEFSEKSGVGASSKVEEHFKKLLGKLDGIQKQAEKAKYNRTKAPDAASKALYGAEYKDLQREMDRVAREVTRARKKLADGLDPTAGGDPDDSKPGRRGRRVGGMYGGFMMQAAGALSPIPGANIALAAVRQAQVQYWNEIYKAEAEERKATIGEKLKGGVKGALIGGGIAGLGLAVLGSIFGSRENEQIDYHLGKVGGAGSGPDARALARKMGFLPAEGANVSEAVARSTGSTAGAKGALFMEQAYGLGGASASLLGGLARGGTTLNEGKAEAKLQRVISTGMFQGLKQGRFGEFMEGVTSIVSAQRFGVGERGLDEMTRLLSGMRGWMAGGKGAQAALQLDAALRGEGGPVSRAIALDLSGATKGDYFGGLRKMELGMFGENGKLSGGGFKQGQDYFARWKEMIPDNEFRWHMIGQQTGMPANTVKELEAAVNRNDPGAYAKALETGKSQQERAFQAMIDIGSMWRNFDQAVKDIQGKLGEILRNTGIIQRIADALDWIAGKMGRSEEPKGLTEKVTDTTGRSIMMRPEYAREWAEQQRDRGIAGWNAMKAPNPNANWAPSIETPEQRALEDKWREQAKKLGFRWQWEQSRYMDDRRAEYVLQKEAQANATSQGSPVPVVHVDSSGTPGHVVEVSVEVKPNPASPDAKNAAGATAGRPPHLGKKRGK